jgi:hypothetical protein
MIVYNYKTKSFPAIYFLVLPTKEINNFLKAKKYILYKYCNGVQSGLGVIIRLNSIETEPGKNPFILTKTQF